MCAQRTALLLLTVVVCGVNGLLDRFGGFGNTQPQADGNAAVAALGAGSAATGTRAIVDESSSTGLAASLFRSSDDNGGLVGLETDTSARRGSFDGAAASSSGTLIGNGVRSAGLFGGSTAKEDGTAAAFSTSSGTTKDKLFVSSSSRARGGRNLIPPPKSTNPPSPPKHSSPPSPPKTPRPHPPPPSSSPHPPPKTPRPHPPPPTPTPPPPPDCSKIHYCTKCVRDKDAQKGIRCTHCEGRYRPSPSGHSCKPPPPPDCSIVKYCTKCMRDRGAPRGIRCQACSGGKRPSANGNACIR